MRFSTTLLFAIVTAFALALPVAGSAAPPDGKKAAAKTPGETATQDAGAKNDDAKDRKKARPRVPRNMPSIQEVDAIEIIGRIQKPEVFYVLGRTDFSYRGLSLKKSFVDRIRRSVKSNPF